MEIKKGKAARDFLKGEDNGPWHSIRFCLSSG